MVLWSTFRRTFAYLLRKASVDTIAIKRPGWLEKRWLFLALVKIEIEFKKEDW